MARKKPQSKKQRTNSNKLGRCSRTCKGMTRVDRKSCLRDCMKGSYKWTKAAKKRSGKRR